MKNLFSIGEIARQQNISRQTLIFYDKIGLFRPAHVDRNSGYRYYSASQLDELDTICIMKRIGFSLEEIKAHMKHYTMDDSIIALRRQLTAIERQIDELRLLKSRVEHRCAQLEQVAALADGEAVTEEEVELQHILVQPVNAPYSLADVSLATKECFVRSFREELPVFFQSGAIVPYARIQAGRYTEASFAFLPIEQGVRHPDIRELPAGRCVCTYHTGDYRSTGKAYERLLAYCEEHALPVISDAYEFAINDYLSTGDESEYITRLLLYVQP